ncbi:FadR/GntR family transcriptional regulator [Streptomyces sp. NPDC021080]|uniref:FadR/GntR family transcriptional regulator n=1 Tax=Streptomyces sp. NPDC021080 TaxID=3365110 RepID=UPI003797D9AA
MAELIASRLRGRIVRGELGEGQSLPPETELMEQFGVSRPTLREAFRILEAESLINVRRGARGGAQVMSPDPAVAARYVGLLLQVDRVTIGDVYEARMILEPAAAAMLARRRTSQDLEDMRACIEELREMVDGRSDPVATDSVEWSLAAQRFHNLVLDRAGNRTLAVQAAMLREVISRHLAIAVSRLFDPVHSPADFRNAIRSYTKLVDLVALSDAEAAEQHWRRHLEVTATFLVPKDDSETVVDLFQ